MQLITPHKIAILTANIHSAYSSSVLQLALDNNIKVSCIIVKKNAIFSTITNEFRKNKIGFVQKILKKIVLQRLSLMGIKSNYLDGFSQYFFDNFNHKSNLLALTQKFNIPIVKTENFHDERTLILLKESNLDLIVFTGGGLIRKALIQIPRMGIINCHMGILPFYRGMDCTYWAMLEKEFDKIGFTTHLMDEGVDTGAIIKRYFVNHGIEKGPNYIVNKIEYMMAPAIVESMLLILNNKITLEIQNKMQGKQYYTISNTLKKGKYYGL
jgi:folate-dependent phosphoribosylglycinamide formyltransferase PurN